MSTPDFSQAIAEAQRAAAAKAAEAAAEQERQAQEKRRAAGVARDLLDCVILPHITAAQEQLCQAGVSAEVGNGRDSYGSLRRSLTIFPADGSPPPRLVFTLEENVPMPFVGVHQEPCSPCRSTPVQLTDTSEDSIYRIIGKFIRTNHP